MPYGTSFADIYAAIGAVVLRSTGRSWWKKSGVQAQPAGVYATVYITAGQGIQNVVHEVLQRSAELETGEIFKEIVWGTQYLDCQAEFIRTSGTDTAIAAATRFANALRLEARDGDLYLISALSGGVKITDISAIFRADVEPRARVDFRLIANITEPDGLADVNIFDIQHQPIKLTAGDGVEETFTINNDGSVEWPST